MQATQSKKVLANDSGNRVSTVVDSEIASLFQGSVVPAFVVGCGVTFSEFPTFVASQLQVNKACSSSSLSHYLSFVSNYIR